MYAERQAVAIDRETRGLGGAEDVVISRRARQDNCWMLDKASQHVSSARLRGGFTPRVVK